MSVLNDATSIRYLLAKARYSQTAWIDQPRDSRGRWTDESGAVSRSHSGLRFIPHPIAQDAADEYTTIIADAAKLDAEWSKDSGYLPQNERGKSEVDGRRERFTHFMKTGRDIEQPYVVISDGTHRLSFGDGRHRTRVLIDSGVKSIPLTVPAEDAAQIQRLVGMAD